MAVISGLEALGYRTVGNNLAPTFSEKAKGFLRGRSYRTQQEVALAKALCQKLEEDAPSFLKIADNFDKNRFAAIKSKDLAPDIDRLQRTILAVKHGIDPQVFQEDSNPGLYHFAKYNYLHNKFQALDDAAKHRMHLDEEGHAGLLCQGEVKPWVEIPDTYSFGYDPIKQTTLNAYYTCEGWVPRPNLREIEADPTEPTLEELDPAKKEDIEKLISRAIVYDRQEVPDHLKGEWVVSVMTQCQDGHHTFKGLHSWLRLRTPDGRMISMGLYRQKFEFMVQRAYMHMVDDYESYKGCGPKVETPFVVSQEKWGKVLQQLLIDTRDSGEPYDIVRDEDRDYDSTDKVSGAPYCHVRGNCTAYVTRMMRMIDVNLDTKVPFSEFILNKKLPPLLANIVSTIIAAVTYKITNLKAVEPRLLEKKKVRWITTDNSPIEGCKVRSIYTKFSDIFNSDKEDKKVDSPTALRERQREIEHYRQQQVGAVPETLRSQAATTIPPWMTVAKK
ncbi:MAG: hypothetical protein ACQEP8_00610 [Chlamydiota bacterium]